MGRILGHWRITAATLFALILIGGAYVFARGIENPPTAQASAETELLKAIAKKDSDGDGVPDWQEALYGTDPHITDTFKLGMSDGDAIKNGLIVPKAIADMTVTTTPPSTPSTIDYAAQGLTPPSDGTLTDAFAKNFFSLYLNAKQANGGADLSASDASAVANDALNSLSTSISTASNYKSATDLTVAGTGSDALRTFAASVDTLFHKNSSAATTSEILFLEQAVANNDTNAVAQLVSIAKQYRETAAGVAALAVPQELATSDLELINSLMHVSEIVNDFARVNVDPLTAMFALQQYVPASQSLRNAFIDVSNVYVVAGVSIPNGTPGSSLVNFASQMKL